MGDLDLLLMLVTAFLTAVVSKETLKSKIFNNDI